MADGECESCKHSFIVLRQDVLDDWEQVHFVVCMNKELFGKIMVGESGAYLFEPEPRWRYSLASLQFIVEYMKELDPIPVVSESPGS